MGRAPCCDKANVKRGPWSPEEDTILKNYLENHGTAGNWIALPRKAGLKRCGKSCRLRWLNYLRPDIKHGGFTQEEDNIIYTLYSSIGSRWSVIASRLPGRTDNDIKNYWNTKLKKRLLAGKFCLNSSNHDLITTNNTAHHHLSSTQSSASVPKVETFYYGDSTTSYMLPYITGTSDLDPITQVRVPGLMEASDYSSLSSVQEASSFSISSAPLTLESKSVVSCSAMENVEELGISLLDFGFDSSYELLYEFDFPKPTSHEVAPDLGNFPFF